MLSAKNNVWIQAKLTEEAQVLRIPSLYAQGVLWSESICGRCLSAQESLLSLAVGVCAQSVGSGWVGGTQSKGLRAPTGLFHAPLKRDIQTIHGLIFFTATGTLRRRANSPSLSLLVLSRVAKVDVALTFERGEFVPLLSSSFIPRAMLRCIGKSPREKEM